MPALLRSWKVPLALLLLVAAGYSFAAKQETRRTPIQELEAVVERYQLKHDAETNVQTSLAMTADQREIHIRPRWGKVEFDKDGGMSISGITAWSVGVYGWNVELQRALFNALNDSPATAQQLVKHPDERIQFLLLKVFHDWGHNIKSITDENRLGDGKPWDLQPHAVEALLDLAGRNDPCTVGTVITALQFKGRFSTDVFLAAMAHNSSDIRAEALRWLNPERQQLTSDEILVVAPVLIEHLTDRDIIVREWSLTSLQSLVAYWEQSLGGAPYDVVRTDQGKMIKLPVAPASNYWHRVVFPQMSELALQYQAEWETWLEGAKQSL